MKNTILFLLTLCVNIAIAQDLIVTQEGDTINAKITKVKLEMIYFTFKHDEEIRNTMIHYFCPANCLAFSR